MDVQNIARGAIYVAMGHALAEIELVSSLRGTAHDQRFSSV
jgi:hypothetical protein